MKQTNVNFNNKFNLIGKEILMPVYLDCNATTPLEPDVFKAMKPYLLEEFGNSGSRTHEFGQRANKAVQKARKNVARVVDCPTEDVIFTSGATESNNIAILGLADFAKKSRKTHFVTSTIEHKAVLEPLQHLEGLGFDVTYIQPNEGGRVTAREVIDAVSDQTALVSIMHVNNETGVIQPIEEIATALEKTDTLFHVDAAQSFGKLIPPLQHKGINMISISGHKIYGPKGVGALITRTKDFIPLPLAPLMFGGGQEKNLRPGTMPVHLVVGLGRAAELALRDHKKRTEKCGQFKKVLINSLDSKLIQINGDQDQCINSTLNITFRGIDSEGLMLALKDDIAISNGSACTSATYEPSHVLKAMGLREERIEQAVRLSWCHLTPKVDWKKCFSKLKLLF